MMTRVASLSLACLLLTPSLASAAPTAAKVDRAHSSIKFKATTKLFDADGVFKKWGAKGTVDPDDFTKSKVTIEIRTSSIDTANGARDIHLRSGDFFDVDKHPTMTFTSRRITKGKGNGAYVVEGVLDIKGKKTTHKLPVTVEVGAGPKGGSMLHVQGRTTLDRNKVGIDYKASVFQPSIGKDVDVVWNLNFKLPKASKAAPAPAPKG